MADGIFKLRIYGQITKVEAWIAGQRRSIEPLGGMRIAVSGSPGERYHSDIKYSAYSQAGTSNSTAGRFNLDMRISGSERMLYVYSMLNDYVVLDYLIPMNDTDYECATTDSVYDGAITKHVDIRVMESSVAESIHEDCRFIEADYASLVELHLAGGLVGLRGKRVVLPMESEGKRAPDSQYRVVDPSLLIPRRIRALEERSEVVRKYAAELKAERTVKRGPEPILALFRMLEVAETEAEKQSIRNQIHSLQRSDFNGESVD